MRHLKAELKEALLDKLRPGVEERRRTQSVAERAVEAARRRAEELSVDVEVSLQGSIAKDTWISGDKDVDVFIRLPLSLGRRGLEEVGMKIARGAAAALGEFIEGYAEHPYVQAFVEGYRIDLVPCFKLERVEEEATAVDRTPFHTEYVKSRLTDELRDEARLLKGFTKGIGVYGAEIRVQGFSGYLCELLTLHYGGFEGVLEAASRWRPWRVFIDPARHYSDPAEAAKLFSQPLVVVDPVDAKRNVAAALSAQRMAEFTAASRLFLKRPSELFFYPPPPREVGDLASSLKQRGTHLVAFKVPIARVAPDVLWGQLYKSMEGLESLLHEHGFEVLDRSAWSDEGAVAVITFELASLELARLARREGPPLDVEEHLHSFLRKHLGRDLKGPRLEGWRWVSFAPRRFTNAATLLRDGWHRARLGSLIHEGAERGLEVLVDGEVSRLASALEGYRKHLAEVLDGRPPWLRAFEEAFRGGIAEKRES
jgi:tRNA nucleotidyltransferase (CCA-adding enzyme)